MTHSSGRLRPIDVLTTGAIGIRTRRGRSALTAIGIALGIAAMVAVVGITASSRADLLTRLDQLGTNLMKVTAGQRFNGGDGTLLPEAQSMVDRIGPVEHTAATYFVDATVRRNDLVPAGESGGIGVTAASLDLLALLDGTVADGVFLDAATERYPTVVLGAVAAQRLGITSLDGGPAVFLGDRWFTVIGILGPLELAPEIDRSVLIGTPIAQELFDVGQDPTAVWVRASEDRIDEVRSVLPATVNPEAPDGVEVTRPSDALQAKAEADRALTATLLGLGAVALLVGGIGIANVMVISVLERTREIGLRRSLGATRGQIRLQFLVEAVALAAIGGTVGVGIGAIVTAVYATLQDRQVAVPLHALVAGVAVALLVGGLAGLYPARRAARLAPADAVRPG